MDDNQLQRWQDEDDENYHPEAVIGYVVFALLVVVGIVVWLVLR